MTQLKLSYHLSYLIKKDLRWGRYVSLSIEPTNSCNLSCPQCPTGTDSLTRNKGLFSMDAYIKMLDEKAKDLLYLNFYFQGEPFINKSLPEMIRMASRKKIYTSVSTNAQLINKDLAEAIVKSGLDRLIVSVDGTSQEVYEIYRKGGALKKVLESTRLLNEAKEKFHSKTPKLVYQFLVFRHNEHQINDVKTIAKQEKVDKVEIKSAQIYNYNNNSNLITSIDRYSRYKKDTSGNYTIKNALKHRCWRMWHSAVVAQDLKVVPCCFDKDVDYEIGNLRNQTLEQIEASKTFLMFRKTITQKRSEIEMCKNCTEGLKL